MKKILTIFLFIFIFIFSLNARGITVEKEFKFEQKIKLDANNEMLESSSSNGSVIFGKKDGESIILITDDGETLLQGRMLEEKPTILTPDTNHIVYSYLIGSIKEDKTVILSYMEWYDISESTDVPQSIIINFFDNNTNKPTSGYIFIDITKTQSVDKIELLSLLRMTEYNIEEGNYEQATELRDQALVMFKELGTGNDINTISELHKISHAYSERNMFSEAVKTESLLVEVFPLAIPDNSLEYALYLNDLAFYSIMAHDQEKASKSFNKAIEILKDIDNEEALANVYIRIAEALSVSDTTKMDVVLDYQQKAIDIYKRIYGETSNETLFEVQYLIKYYEQAGKLQQARSLAKDIWDLKSRLRKDSQESIIDYQNYVRLSDLCGDTIAVLNNIQPLDSLARTTFGEYSDNYIEILLNNESYFQHYRLYDQSVECLIHMLTIADSIHSDNLEPYYNFAYDCAKKLQVLHQHKAASTILHCIIEKESNFAFDKRHLILASKIAYAQSLIGIGDISASLLIINEISSDAIELYGSNSCVYASIMSCKSRCYAQLKDLENAIKYGEISAEIEKSIGHSEHYVSELTWLGGYYHENHQTEKALQCDLNSLSIAKELYGEESSIVIQTYSNIISLDLDDDICKKYNIDLSEIFSNIIAYYMKNPKDEHTKPHFFINDLAIKYAFSGNIEMSHKLFMKSLEVAKNRYGTDSEDHIRILENYSLMCLLYDPPCLSRCLYDLINIKKQKTLKDIPFLDTSSRNKVWADESFWFQNFVSLCLLENPSDSIAAIAFDATLFSKGFLLGTDIEIGRLIEEEGNSEIQTAYENLINKRKNLERLYQSGAQAQICESAENDIKNDELQMLSMSKRYSSYMSNFKATWRDLKSKISDKDLAVEILQLPISSDTTQYIALTVKKGYDAPHMVKLFTDQDLQAVKSSYYKNPELSKLLWGKMADELDGVENIYFSPSGELYNIAIESMPHWEDSCMMSDKFNLYRLSSTRELAINRSETKSSGAMIYGGIKYDTDVANMGKARTDSESLYAFRGFNPDSTNCRGTIWSNLDSTLVEANIINTILTNSNITVSKLTGVDATESSLKDLSGQKKRMLHIATHGFYWNESTAAEHERDKLRFLQMDDDQPHYVEDKAMTRSGLLFAGAQNIFNGIEIPAGVDDGVLTSQEISQLDLRGLDLLVLSACQTGLGEIKGDGVFGLQRGFKKAGAQSIMMSLWEVSDAATKDLMIQFYTALTSGMTKRQAFIKAQEYVKEHDASYGYDSFVDSNGQKVSSTKARNRRPHWAAFILLDAL